MDQNPPDNTKSRLLIFLAIGIAGLLLLVGVYYALANRNLTKQMGSSSMLPTLHAGDIVAFSQVQQDTLLTRGDIILFLYPNSDLLYIKRLIGLPGDTIAIKKGVIYLNGEPQKQTKGEAKSFLTDRCIEQKVRLYKEDFDGRSYSIFHSEPASMPTFLHDKKEQKIPAGKTFVLGDNRHHSADSRTWGYLPLENIKGIAQSIVLSYDQCAQTYRSHKEGMLLNK